MSERTEVTKVVENVDRLFSEIVVNGESHVSDRYVPPEPANTPVLNTNQSEDEEEQTAEQNDEPVQGEYVKAVELNNILHDFNDEELAERVTEVQGDITRIDGDISDINNSITGIEADIESAEGDIADLNSDVNRIDTTIGTVQTDIGRLNNRVSDVEGSVSNLQSDVTDIDSDVDTLQIDVGGLQSELTTLNNLLGTIQSRVNEINTLIPNQASAQNQLADKGFVNSSIASNTANFMGTYTSLTDIEAIPNPTNNDYAFLQTTDQAGNTVYKRYKYSADTTQWLYEYDLNNSSFTAEQWATINSGLTQSSVAQSILNAIDALDVASAGGSGKYISEIQENNGKIQATEGSIASAVTSGDNSPVSSDAVAQAITDLCASAVGGSGKYIATLQQTDGKVLATEGTFSNTVQSGDYAPVTSDAVAQAIASSGVSAVDAVVSGCMSPVTSNAVANWSPNNFTVGNAMHIGANGTIYADGSCANYPMIKFKDSSDPYGNGVVIGGGGAVVIGGGESADTYYSGAGLAGGDDVMAITNDGAIEFASNLQDGYACRKVMTFSTSGYLSVPSTFTTSMDNNGSWWVDTNPRGKFVGTNGGSTGGWSPLLAGKTVNGKYELGSLNNTIYLNYYCDSRTTNGIDKTIFEYAQGGTPIWYGNVCGTASSVACASDSAKLNGYGSSISATANTVVARDANGYIYGSYFNSNIGDENINSYGGTALIFSGSDHWFRRTPPSCVCVGSAGSAGAVWYGSAVFCIWCSSGNYWVCNRCSFPAMLTPLSTQINSCHKRKALAGLMGAIFASGACCCISGCSTDIGNWNSCVAGTRVYQY